MPGPDSRAPVVSPVAKAIALVESGIFDSYVVVEREGVCTVAGGTRAVITLDGDQVRVRCHGSESRRSWLTRPLTRLGEVLAGLPIGGSAWGWVAFELAHLLAGRRDLAGNGVLVQLIVPRAEVRISPASIAIDCANPVLQDRIELVLGAALGLPEPRLAADHAELPDEWYSSSVADAVWSIGRGNVSNVLLSANIKVKKKLNLARTYLAGRAESSFLLNLRGMRALGSCPEAVSHPSWAEFEGGFPSELASGTPKYQACAHIARSERGARGLYGGAIVTAGPDGRVLARTVLGALVKGVGLRVGAHITGSSSARDGCAEVAERLREVAPYLVSGS